MVSKNRSSQESELAGYLGYRPVAIAGRVNRENCAIGQFSNCAVLEAASVRGVSIAKLPDRAIAELTRLQSLHACARPDWRRLRRGCRCRGLPVHGANGAMVWPDFYRPSTRLAPTRPNLRRRPQ